MAIWPFGRRKSNRRHALNNGAGVPSADPLVTHNSRGSQDHGKQSGGELGIHTPERRRSARDRKRKSLSREAKKLQRDPSRTYSFSPGRNDSIQVTRDQDRPPVPPIPINFKGKGSRAQTDLPDRNPTDEKIARASTQPQEQSQWERMPTLHKKSPQEVGRRKSSKRKKEDHEREAEIRAMAAFMPTRPAAESGSSGRLMKRESRKMRGALDANNKSSDVSLPLAGSIHSSLSGSENQASFKLSGLDMLAPRPTIKYSEFPRYIPPTNMGMERSASKKRRISERISIPEETLKANKRIDELADDLDAAGLRELMERDQKRREKKKVAERIRAERRLTRRQEKQKAEEAVAARDGTPPPVNLDRGVLGREVVGLGIGTSAVITSSKRKSSSSSQGRKQPSDHFEKEDSDGSDKTPELDAPTPASERSEPVIETAQVGRISRASMSQPNSPRGHARGASSISQMIDLTKSDTPKPIAAAPQVQQSGGRETPPPVIPAAESTSRRNSENQQRSSWTSFFKRRSKQSKHESTQSSFSNTSRDSMHNLHQAPSIGYAPMRTSSNIPKRTMSKFREDLPELPLSPPDSRVQSPEAETLPSSHSRALEKTIESEASAVEDSRMRYDTPTSGYRSLETARVRNETPTSGHRSIAASSPEQAIVSHSLASIDSEGSWLSGRRAGTKRTSIPTTTYPPQESAQSLQRRYQQYSDSSEELGIAEDEYFSRLSPEPESPRARRISGNPMPSSDEEDGSVVSPTPTEQSRTKWGAVGRTPTVVHREPRAKSREGLLNDFENDSEPESPEPSRKEKRRSYGFNKSVIEEGEGLQRARSVELGRGHVRKISAGSARLLDVKRSGSTDSKRMLG